MKKQLVKGLIIRAAFVMCGASLSLSLRIVRSQPRLSGTPATKPHLQTVEPCPRAWVVGGGLGLHAMRLSVPTKAKQRHRRCVDAYFAPMQMTSLAEELRHGKAAVV
ncbi:hypothetical protein IF1G_03832 [Cordyceps javanica]|uniref:Uncharacterized protein n=1 Tax=Cordyceps javanica TaxID=43265 RepID=A0A545V8Z9_9HYPO|nr:hypothetical protein IF1G_03832 [Cordyceps javanica]